MLRLLLMVASFANCAGGIVLIATWATMWQQVPPIALFIGGSLLIQGGYTILYLHGELEPWGEIPTGVLLAGEGLSACVGAGALVLGLLHNMNTSDIGDGTRARRSAHARPGRARVDLLAGHRQAAPPRQRAQLGLSATVSARRDRPAPGRGA